MIELRCQNRAATIVVVPSASALIIAELGAKVRIKKKGGKDKGAVEGVKHDGNLTMDQVIKIARVMHPKSLSREFRGTVKQILGTW